jgi:hypothetical protein
VETLYLELILTSVSTTIPGLEEEAGRCGDPVSWTHPDLCIYNYTWPRRGGREVWRPCILNLVPQMLEVISTILASSGKLFM